MNEQSGWTQAAKELLDASAQDLDAATLSRLNRARQGALGHRRRAPRWVIPAGLASACMVLLAIALWHGRTGSPVHNAAEVAVANDASADDDEFYEDLDFYAWLEAQEQGPEG